ncbi:MAG: hypothetical protein CVT80_13325 [Alphaproteobacteria bacterium HGW-Alphaproteobacteria-2]|nr:MAG: hypothetical protein CVT80_13325 [Alphaproteobacteria bacterium HGW-Alphaproteobacteria-2]
MIRTPGSGRRATRRSPASAVWTCPNAVSRCLPRNCPGARPEARIMPALCRDAATGMPHPDTVTLEQGEERLAGCGGAPIALLAGGEWIVEDIGGGGIIDSSHVTLAVDRSGRVAGRGGCNRYFGPLTITGEGIAFGLIGATMMACGEALMAQERRFFDALAAVARFDLDPTGALLLIGADGRVLVRARRG